jgi:DNA-binding LacI/PurR family transcriptional regulator
VAAAVSRLDGDEPEREVVLAPRLVVRASTGRRAHRP